ncbi:hypothetical protein GCM10018954_025840 [Kutzneria kofuensis]
MSKASECQVAELVAFGRNTLTSRFWPAPTDIGIGSLTASAPAAMVSVRDREKVTVVAAGHRGRHAALHGDVDGADRQRRGAAEVGQGDPGRGAGDAAVHHHPIVWLAKLGPPMVMLGPQVASRWAASVAAEAGVAQVASVAATAMAASRGLLVTGCSTRHVLVRSADDTRRHRISGGSESGRI